MRDYDIAEFESRLGEQFLIEDAHGARLELRLDQVERLPAFKREGGAFRLELSGPPLPYLDQAIWPLQNGGELFQIFVVPIKQDAAQTTYEAIFQG
ncbi:MAG TPA: hypothetical protein VGC35_00795 [Allosphingosinicella sp.]|jgi:hypothetical protein